MIHQLELPIVNIHEAKTTLSKLVARVAAGEEIVIARSGTPVAKLVPLGEQPKRREWGAWRGKIWLSDEFSGGEPT